MCPRERHTYCTLKRFGDAIMAAILIVALAPVFVAVALLVAVKLGRPVLFTQKRPGAGGRIFTILKFRTMLDPDPASGLISDDARLTPFGRVLRSTSLDELPGLVNVLRGDMSFIGPRPLLVKYLERYDPTQARRHDVRPGVTGLAQVRGRNAVSWDDRLHWDIEYVETHSFALDLRITLKTVVVVASRSGISAPGHVTKEEFLGSNPVAT